PSNRRWLRRCVHTMKHRGSAKILLSPQLSPPQLRLLQSQAHLNQGRQNLQHRSQPRRSQLQRNRRLQSQPLRRLLQRNLLQLSQLRRQLRRSLQLQSRAHLSQGRQNQRLRSLELQSLVHLNQVLRVAQPHALCRSQAAHAVWLITHFLPAAVQEIVLHHVQAEQRGHARSHRVVSVTADVQTTVITSH